MATQNCPKCGSNKIRHGYRPTHILLKIIFRYNLLCKQCNWEFNGFAIPGTISKKTKKNDVEAKPINVSYPTFSAKADSNLKETEDLSRAQPADSEFLSVYQELVPEPSKVDSSGKLPDSGKLTRIRKQHKFKKRVRFTVH